MKKTWNKIWKRNQIMITALACMIAIAGYLNFTGRQLEDETLYTTSAQFEEMPEAEGITAQNETEAGDELAAAEMEVNESETALYEISQEDIESLDSDLELSSENFLDEGTAEGMALAENGAVEDAAGTDVLAQGAAKGEVPGEAVFTSATGITSLAEANLIKEQTRARNKEALLEIINSASLSEAAKADAVNSMINLTEIAQKECDAEILLEAKGFENAVVSISGEQVDVMIGASELTEAQRAQIEDIVKRKTQISAENIIISPVGKNE